MSYAAMEFPFQTSPKDRQFPEPHPLLAMTTTALPALPSTAPSRYRFSAVDDLQLPPALSVTTLTPLHTALTLALEREYSQLTVVSPERKKLLGYLDVPATVHALETGSLEMRGKGKGEGGLSVGDVFTRFDRRKSLGYTVITPDTSLDVLDEFLQQHDFAIGSNPAHCPLWCCCFPAFGWC